MRPIYSLLILGTLSCFGQSKDPIDLKIASEHTGSFWNGRYWASLSESEKYIFVFAYVDAVNRVVLDLTKDSTEYKKVAPLFIPELSINESRAGIQSFYGTPENAPIPIAEAFKIVAMKTLGYPDTSVNKVLNEMRQAAHK